VVSTGSVSSFDEKRGIGLIQPQSAADSDPIIFHCIEIADGTRRIADGTEVTYQVRLKLGKPEAFAVTKCDETTG
jgi:cold shock CspA family protein